MRHGSLLLAFSQACASGAEESGLVFSTLLGDSPPWVNTVYAPGRQFHPFDVAYLAQAPKGDYYVLGTTALGTLPWKGGGPTPFPYCGTVMTPGICTSLFLAHIDASGSTLLAATLIPRSSGNISAAGLVIDAAGNALVLGALREQGAPIGKSFILRITPAGEMTTIAELSAEATWLGHDERGNLFVAGHDYTVGQEKPGYLAVFDPEGNKIRVLSGLPWNPGAAAVSPGGSLYVVSRTTLRKFKPLLVAEEAHTEIPAGALAIDFSPAEEVLIGGSDGHHGFSGAWSDSLLPLREPQEFYGCPGPMAFGPTGDLYSASSAAQCPLVTATPGSAQPCRGLGGAPSDDVVLMILRPGFDQPTYATYLGGGEDDFAGAILTHPDGSLTVAGSTWSQNFPVTSGVADKINGGMSLFLSRIRPQAGPLLSPRCIANAASLMPGPIVAGAIYSIFGAGIGAGEVRFDGVAAQMLYSSKDQINVRIPDTVSGTSRMELIVDGTSTGAIETQVAPAYPGIFTMNAIGTGPAVATNEDGALNSAANPARPGSAITLYATGVPASGDGLRVYLYGPEPAQIIRVERLPSGVLAIQARLTPVYPDSLGVQICVAAACSRPVDHQSNFTWQQRAPRGVSLYLRLPGLP